MLFPQEIFQAKYYVFKEPVFWFPAEARTNDEGLIYFVGSQAWSLMKGKYICSIKDIWNWQSGWHLFDSTGEQELNHQFKPVKEKTKHPRKRKTKEEKSDTAQAVKDTAQAVKSDT